MLKPKWIKKIEGHFPERLASKTDKLGVHARGLGRALYRISARGITEYERLTDFYSEKIEEIDKKLREKGIDIF